MNTNTIECPKCHTKIEVSKAITAQLTDQIRTQLQADVDAQKAELTKESRKLEKQKAAIQQAAEDMERQLKEGIEAGVESQRAAIVAQARKKAEADLALERREQTERISELESKLKELKRTELGFLKRERELNEKSEALELDVARRVKKETDAIRVAARKQADEEHLLKDRQTQEQNDALRRQVEDLKRKLEQGSQQAQGEALELVLEDLLGRAFPHDEIEEVSKGVNGGDWIQHVMEPSGLECGSILWETKNAKKWSPAWLPKLRQDQRDAKAAMAVLVTESMPPGSQHLTEIDGVWVCTRACAVTLGAALRSGLVELAKNRQASDGKHGKIGQVYDYLTGAEFRRRVTGMVEPLVQLQDGLARQRRSMERILAAQEKQVETAILSMNGLYGDLQGIVGCSTLPTLEQMDLPQLEAASTAGADGAP